MTVAAHEWISIHFWPLSEYFPDVRSHRFYWTTTCRYRHMFPALSLLVNYLGLREGVLGLSRGNNMLIYSGAGSEAVEHERKRAIFFYILADTRSVISNLPAKELGGRKYVSVFQALSMNSSALGEHEHRIFFSIAKHAVALPCLCLQDPCGCFGKT